MAKTKWKDRLHPETASDDNVKWIIVNFVEAECLDLVLDRTAEEARLDSLDRAELIMVMEEKFCLSLDDNILQAETTLKEFRDAVLLAARKTVPKEIQEAC